MILNEIFFFERKRDTIKRLLQFISGTKLRRERERERYRISSGGFQRKLVHGNASSSWISRLLSRRNNSLYLCHPPVLLTLLFFNPFSPPLSLSLPYLLSLLPSFFSNSYYSSRIILFLFFFFLPPSSSILASTLKEHVQRRK